MYFTDEEWKIFFITYRITHIFIIKIIFVPKDTFQFESHSNVINVILIRSIRNLLRMSTSNDLLVHETAEIYVH